MIQEHREQEERLTRTGIDLLKYHNLLHYHFMAVFPFVSKRNIFYWVTIKIPQSESYEGYPRCDLLVTDPNLPSGSPARLLFNVKDNKATIEDIVVSRQNQGIGSYLLALLEKLVVHLGAEVIAGMLSPVDAGHRSTQVAFYEKNGYTVTLSPDGKYGGIKKHLI
jgi:GNAT superfamily N-acetyltransferase